MDDESPGANNVIVTFGEIMARMAPPGVLRLCQTLPGSLDVTFAGAEANVSASLAMLGASTRFITALPDNNPLTDACLKDLRGFGIDVSKIRVVPQGRFGIYFVETGANQRPSRVTYDRQYSAISLATPDDFDWACIFDKAAWLHITGITPALSSSAASVTLEAVRQARAAGVRVSCDVNFRSTLWRWDAQKAPAELAGTTLRQLMPYINMFSAGEEDCRLIGMNTAGLPSYESQPVAHQTELASRIVDAWPDIEVVSMTWRQSHSASHNNWGGGLFDAGSQKFYYAPNVDGEFKPYEIRSIVDRVGGGDAHMAALLYGLNSAQFPDFQAIVEFATAASCLAHSVVGDFNFASQTEIAELVAGSGSGRVVR
ncbi:MAG: sugar kinase [Planctomycetaceae bacterium]